VVTSSVAGLTIVPNLHFYETNLIVIRVGDGAQALTLNGNSIFLDQFAPGGTYLQTMNIPDQGAAGMIAIGWNNVNLTSGSVTGSGLTRSANGRYIVLAGYNASLGNGVALNTTAASDVPRGVALIDSHAQYSLALASTSSVYNQTFWRAAVADGTNNFWGAAGTGGTLYFGLDEPAEQVQTQFINVRAMSVFNGSIYCASAVAAASGILKLDGMPRTAATANPTVLFPGTTGFSDMEVRPDGNLIYVADDRAMPAGGIQRWEFDGSTWNLMYTLDNGFGTAGPRYVTADFSGPNPKIYAITKESDNNRIVRVDDIGAGSVGSTVAYAGANQTFRGARFGPLESAARPILAFAQQGNNLILTWSGSFPLLSSTTVDGQYVQVPGATSPYTNSISSASQRFYGLGQ
jgi:hypothetical protein